MLMSDLEEVASLVLEDNLLIKFTSALMPA